MMYWMPKFKYANPYRVPYELPDDQIELSKLALKRMAVDLENEISVFQVIYKTFVCLFHLSESFKFKKFSAFYIYQ